MPEDRKAEGLLSELRALAATWAVDDGIGPMEREHRLSTLDAVARQVEREGMPQASMTVQRASQFKPFAALRGYEEEVAAREQVVEPRRPMTEEHARVLQGALDLLERGDEVRLVAYDEDLGTYVERRGQVRQVLGELGVLRLEEGTVALGDLWEIQPLGRTGNPCSR